MRKKTDLEKMYHQVKNLDKGLLLAGLMVLVKDTANFLHEGGYDDPMVEEFRQEYLNMLNYDRFYWTEFGGQLFDTLPEAGLPHGIVKRVVQCETNLSDLCSEGVEQEFTRAPGWEFFKSYSRSSQELILDQSSLDTEKSRAGSVAAGSDEEFKIVAEYVDKLTSRSQIGTRVWSTVMLYISLLIVRTHFVTFSADEGDLT